jgi:hypothetical protein
MSDYMDGKIHAIMDAVARESGVEGPANEVLKFGAFCISAQVSEQGSVDPHVLLAEIAAYVNENFTWLGTRDLPKKR